MKKTALIERIGYNDYRVIDITDNNNDLLFFDEFRGTNRQKYLKDLKRDLKNLYGFENVRED